MADLWTPTTPITWTAGNLSVANLNQELRDRMEALRATQTDSSTDTDMWLAVKNGTFANRATVTQKAGRKYYATDYHAEYISDGTNWYHLTGRGAYDDFERANSTTLGSANSGHPWTESVADQEINGNALRAVSLSGGISVATVDTGGIIESGRYIMGFTTGATGASINIAIVLKWVDSSNHLYVQLHGTFGLRLVKVVAGVATALSTQAYGVGTNTYHTLIVDLNGSFVNSHLYGATAFAGYTAYGRLADVVTPFTTPTKIGVQFGTAAHDKVEAFSFKPN